MIILRWDNKAVKYQYFILNLASLVQYLLILIIYQIFIYFYKLFVQIIDSDKTNKLSFLIVNYGSEVDILAYVSVNQTIFLFMS